MQPCNANSFGRHHLLHRQARRDSRLDQMSVYNAGKIVATRPLLAAERRRPISFRRVLGGRRLAQARFGGSVERKQQRPNEAFIEIFHVNRRFNASTPKGFGFVFGAKGASQSQPGATPQGVCCRKRSSSRRSRKRHRSGSKRLTFAIAAFSGSADMACFQ